MTSKVFVSRAVMQSSLTLGLGLLLASCATTTPAQLSYWSDTDVCKLAGASPWFYAQGDIDNARQEAVIRKIDCIRVVNTYQSSGAYAADRKQKLDEAQTHLLFMQKLKQPPPTRYSECYNIAGGVRCEYYGDYNTNTGVKSYFDCYPTGNGYRCE